MFKRLGLLLVACFCVCLIGCCKQEGEAKTEKSSSGKYGGVYRRAFADPYLLLDPACVKESNSNEVCRQLYDGLVEFSASDTVVPCLAESWSISENKLSYIFKLRKDVRFHGYVNGVKTKNAGRLFCAEDVQFSFERLLSPNRKCENIFFMVIKGAKAFSEGKSQRIEGIKVLASDSIQFELEHPYAPFVSILGISNAFIVPREDAETIDKLPVGTGAFKWKGRGDDRYILEANHDYFRGRPWLDSIEFVFIPKEEERFKEFEAGRLQHVDLPDSVYKKIKYDPELSKYILESNLWGLNFLGMNLTEPPFDNKLVRQALNYAIDRDSIVKLILNSRAQSANGILTPGIPGHDPLLPGYFYDLPKAKHLLSEAGYPEGKDFPIITLEINEDQLQQRVADFVVANLQDLGIECRLAIHNFAEHLENIENGRAPFFRMGWTIDYPDPDGFLYTMFHSSNIGDGYNYYRYKNPEVDRLLNEARNETELMIRVPIYEKAEKIIVDDAPMVFLYFYTLNLLRQPNVQGLKVGAMGECALQYRRIWLD